jgi:endonuclease YncB( thermonuclease family)
MRTEGRCRNRSDQNIGSARHAPHESSRGTRKGRLLAYLYLSDGRMFNEEIVKAGYANLMTYPPNVKYQERFLKAYQEAKDKGRGLWR